LTGEKIMKELEESRKIQSIYVTDEIQKNLFLYEYKGQISDGEWENALPIKHWMQWMLKPEQIVISAENIVGYKSFVTPMRHYNFLKIDLLETIGGRMCLIANATANKLDINFIANNCWAFYKKQRTMNFEEIENYLNILKKSQDSYCYNLYKKIADYFGYTDTMLVAAINEKLCNPYKNYYMLIPEIKILNKAVNTSYTLGYDASSLVANLKENF